MYGGATGWGLDGPWAPPAMAADSQLPTPPTSTPSVFNPDAVGFVPVSKRPSTVELAVDMAARQTSGITTTLTCDVCSPCHSLALLLIMPLDTLLARMRCGIEKGLPWFVLKLTRTVWQPAPAPNMPPQQQGYLPWHHASYLNMHARSPCLIGSPAAAASKRL